MSTSLLRRRSFGPILFTLIAYAGLLWAWQALAVPRLPSALHRVGSRVQNLVWVERGITPFASEGDLDEARLLFVGDSRVWRATCREAFAAEEMGPSAILWGSAARTKELLVAVNKYEPECVVLAISTLGFLEHPASEVKQIFSDVEVPAWDSPEFEQEMAAWRESRIAIMRNANVPPRKYSYTLRTIEKTVRETRTIHSLTPEGIDLRLGRWADDTRSRAIRSLSTDTWNKSWVRRPNPRGSQEQYRRMLSGKALADTRQNMAESARRLRTLRERGIKIVCIRLPFDPVLLEVENEYLDPADYQSFCELAGVRFLDYSKAPFETYDGSHLTASSAPRFSARLARDLREELGW